MRLAPINVVWCFVLQIVNLITVNCSLRRNVYLCFWYSFCLYFYLKDSYAIRMNCIAWHGHGRITPRIQESDVKNKISEAIRQLFIVCWLWWCLSFSLDLNICIFWFVIDKIVNGKENIGVVWSNRHDYFADTTMALLTSYCLLPESNVG